MNILAARKYATPRNGPLILEQTETRRLAYSIKSTASPLIDFDTAAREMAALITGPCWLVPTPRPEPAAVRPRSHRHLLAPVPTPSRGGSATITKHKCIQMLKSTIGISPRPRNKLR